MRKAQCLVRAVRSSHGGGRLRKVYREMANACECSYAICLAILEVSRPAGSPAHKAKPVLGSVRIPESWLTSGRLRLDVWAHRAR